MNAVQGMFSPALKKRWIGFGEVPGVSGQALWAAVPSLTLLGICETSRILQVFKQTNQSVGGGEVGRHPPNPVNSWADKGNRLELSIVTGK